MSNSRAAVWLIHSFVNQSSNKWSFSDLFNISRSLLGPLAMLLINSRSSEQQRKRWAACLWPPESRSTGRKQRRAGNRVEQSSSCRLPYQRGIGPPSLLSKTKTPIVGEERLESGAAECGPDRDHKWKRNEQKVKDFFIFLIYKVDRFLNTVSHDINGAKVLGSHCENKFL